ncbi:MAG: hypothetical protein PWQ35_245 [Patescibacteria group bacterium]|nr:hypothetical protein [Patescibacteria group bacterium]
MAIENVVQTENELIKLAQTGDRSAFAKLYDFYMRKIYDFVYYKTMQKEQTEDIVSQIFLKAWKNINSYQQNSFSAWLYTIARNTVIDFYRQDKNNRNIDDFWDLASNDDLLAKVNNSLQLQKIKKLMINLKSEERDIIIMRFWLDLSFKEIAERLSKNEGAIKMSLKRTLDKIKGEALWSLIIAFPQIENIWKKMS